MFTILFTSYTKITEILVLRNNWTEECQDKKSLLDVLATYKVVVTTIPRKGTVSKIYHGELSIDGVCIHVRIIHF